MLIDSSQQIQTEAEPPGKQPQQTGALLSLSSKSGHRVTRSCESHTHSRNWDQILPKGLLWPSYTAFPTWLARSRGKWNRVVAEISDHGEGQGGRKITVCVEGVMAWSISLVSR